MIYIYTAILILYFVTILCFYLGEQQLKKRVDALEDEQSRIISTMYIFDHYKHNRDTWLSSLSREAPDPTIRIDIAVEKEIERRGAIEKHLGIEWRRETTGTIPAHYEKIKKENKPK